MYTVYQMSYKNKKYFFDTNAFIEIKRVYPKESFHDLHEIIEEFIEDDTILVHHKVYDEICEGTVDDHAKKLLKEHKNKVLQEVQGEYDKLHENSKKILTEDIINPQTKREQADPYLIARILFERENLFSKSLTYCLVTMEKKGLPKKCEHFKIPCMDVLNFFKDTNIKFTTQHGD